MVEACRPFPEAVAYPAYLEGRAGQEAHLAVSVVLVAYPFQVEQAGLREEEVSQALLAVEAFPFLVEQVAHPSSEEREEGRLVLLAASEAYPY